MIYGMIRILRRQNKYIERLTEIHNREVAQLPLFLYQKKQRIGGDRHDQSAGFTRWCLFIYQHIVYNMLITTKYRLEVSRDGINAKAAAVCGGVSD